MTNPNLKLLVNALRLGQPQDPQGAILLLAEACLALEEQLDEAKRRLSVVQSAANIFEAKSTRLEMELDALRAQSPGAAQPSHTPSAPLPSPLAPPKRPTHGPPPMRTASTPPPAIQLASIVDDASQDDFATATVVVHKKDVESLRQPEAPFRLAPAGQRGGPDRGRIPGAPWANPVAYEEPNDDAPDDAETYSDLGSAMGALRPRSPQEPPAPPPEYPPANFDAPLYEAASYDVDSADLAPESHGAPSGQPPWPVPRPPRR
ncbi:MAG: hypothetical protein U0271_46740 [Polyangiaceae bacterium]